MDKFLKNANSLTFVFLLIHLSSCTYSQQNNCIQANNYKCYHYKIDNNDTKTFGFYYYEDDESLGTKAIALSSDSKSAFLVDGFHNNIKKIYLSTGQIVSSNKVIEYSNKQDVSLYDIAVFNDKIYITSNEDIFVFGNDLKFINKISTNIKRDGDITFFEHASQDSLCIFLTEKQMKNLDIEKTYLIVKKDSNYIVKLVSPLSRYKNKVQKNTTLGKEYEVMSNNNNLSLVNQYGCYLLKENIPRIKFYNSRNVDFNRTGIVYFDSTPNEIVIYCYNFSLQN